MLYIHTNSQNVIPSIVGSSVQVRKISKLLREEEVEEGPARLLASKPASAYQIYETRRLFSDKMISFKNLLL